jgi:ribose/xylose/arabinose/galactoside ABC-type transport system permease subunit
MNKYNLLIRPLAIWHIVISALLFLTLLTIYELNWLTWIGIMVYLLLVAATSLVSGIFLLNKKKRALPLSITLGIMLVLLGIILFIYDQSLIQVFKILSSIIRGLFNPPYSFVNPYPNLNPYFVVYGIFDLICFCYGIFATIYFTRKNTILYLNGSLANLNA